MRVGRLLSLPDSYTQFARIKDENGVAYTVDPGQLPRDAAVGKDYAYKVEIWGNDSGLAYEVVEED